VSLLYLPVPILSLLAKDYGITGTQAASSLSAFGFAYATGFLIFGALSDRLGRKTVMVCGLIALAIVTLCLASVPDWQVFIALRVLQGLAAATFPPVALAYLSEHGTPPQKMQAIAWMSTAFLAAGILGQMYAMQVAVPLGMGWALFGLAVVYLITALRLAFIKDKSPDAAAKSWIETYKPVFFLLSDGILRRVCLPAFALTLFAPKLIARLKGPHKVVTLGLAIASIGMLSTAIVARIGMNWHPAWILAGSVVFVAGVALSVPQFDCAHDYRH